MTPGVRESPQGRTKIWNLPNQITASRILLSIALFVALHFQMYFAALVLFLVAASTDWIDGYVARKTGQVTQLGRILDPFADKIVICGAFIFLAAVPDPIIQAWMAVVVVGRELLVTALRGYLEQHGGDFSATMPGKLKVVFSVCRRGRGYLSGHGLDERRHDAGVAAPHRVVAGMGGGPVNDLLWYDLHLRGLEVGARFERAVTDRKSRRFIPWLWPRGGLRMDGT